MRGCPARLGGIAGRLLAVEVIEYSLDDSRFLDAGDHPQPAAASPTPLDVDRKHALQALVPAHRPVRLEVGLLRAWHRVALGLFQTVLNSGMVPSSNDRGSRESATVLKTHTRTVSFVEQYGVDAVPKSARTKTSFDVLVIYAGRIVQPPGQGIVRELEHIGGLHHEYVRMVA